MLKPCPANCFEYYSKQPMKLSEKNTVKFGIYNFHKKIHKVITIPPPKVHDDRTVGLAGKV